MGRHEILLILIIRYVLKCRFKIKTDIDKIDMFIILRNKFIEV